jgi:predicted ribosome quality control (RQC) complex YloA/Tae2 family protein
MGAGHGNEPEASDADAGIFRGRSVARRFVSPDGFVVLVGRTGADNDVLTLRLASPDDVWLHVAGASGSHVVIRNPDRLPRLPRDTLQFAAALAARFSKARKAGRVTVHVTRCADVEKPRGFPAGKVVLKRFASLRAAPHREPEVGDLSSRGKAG